MAKKRINRGISFDGATLSAEDWRPTRKKTALALTVRNESMALAYFRNNDCVDAFNEFIKSLPLRED